MSSFRPLIKVAPTIVNILGANVVTKPVMIWFTKNTFFRHFCGGETELESIPVMKTLQDAGVGSILDLSVEADLIKLDKSLPLDQGKAKVYEDTNFKANQLVLQIKKGIDVASTHRGNSVAIKLTSLVSPVLLKTLTKILRILSNEFVNLSSDGKMKFEQFSKFIQATLPQTTDCSKLFELIDRDNNGTIDWVDCLISFHPLHPETGKLFVGKHQEYEYSQVDSAHAKESMGRLIDLTQYASNKSLHLMYDAEQSYFQRAIDMFVLVLSENFNRKMNAPIVFNTYQMYLKDSLHRVKLDVERAKRCGYSFAAKLVRGAYMVSERKLCEKNNSPHIICDTIEDTHVSYNSGVEFLFKEKQKNNDFVHIVVASHNKKTIELTLDQCQKLGIDPNQQSVMFAQLLGMKDYISFELGEKGRKVYKYVPYGPVDEVIPYLLRRAEENSSILSDSKIDQKHLVKELIRRFKYKVWMK